MEILNKITELRVSKGWSEYELAKNSGLPQSTISSWYRKNMLPSISSLEKICSGLGITLSQFFSETNDNVTLTEEQKNLLKKYSSLTKSQKEKLNIFIEGMTTK